MEHEFGPEVDADTVLTDFLREIGLIHGEFGNRVAQHSNHVETLRSKDFSRPNKPPKLEYTVSDDGAVITPKYKRNDPSEYFLLSSKLEKMVQVASEASITQDAIFIYLVAKFERHQEQLFRAAYRLNTSVKERFIRKFVEADMERFSGRLRDEKYEFMTESEKDEFRISQYGAISKIHGQVNFWTYLYDLKSETFVKDQRWREVCFAYEEIRERRNSLVHRGGTCDSKYLGIFSNSRYGKSKKDTKRRWQRLYDLSSIGDLVNIDIRTQEQLEEVQITPIEKALTKSLSLDVSWPYFYVSCHNLILLFLKLFVSVFFFLTDKRYSFDEHYEHFICLADDAFDDDVDPSIWLDLGVELRVLVEEIGTERGGFEETEREFISNMFLLRESEKYGILSIDDPVKTNFREQLDHLFVKSSDNHVKFGALVLGDKFSEASDLLKEMLSKKEIDAIDVETFLQYKRYLQHPKLKPIFEKYLGKRVVEYIQSET